MSDFNPKEDLKKALHRALATAYHRGNPIARQTVDTSNSDTLKGIVNDLKDPNSTPEMDGAALPVEKDAVLTKDIDTKKEPNAVAQGYDIAQDQKKAALGMNSNPHPEHQHVKQPKPLQSFMKNRAAKQSMQKAEKVTYKNNFPLNDGKKDHKVSYNHNPETRTVSGQVGKKKFEVKDVNPFLHHDAAKDAAQAGMKKSAARNGGFTAPHPQPKPAEKALPKPMAKNHGIASAKHGIKAAQLKYKHEQEKAMLNTQKPQKQSMQKAKGNEKGVHQPHFMAGKKTGTSEVGARMSPHGASKQTNAWAKDQHRKVLNESKAMPKPNLGKARVDEGMRSSEKIQARNARHERVINSNVQAGSMPKVTGHRHPEKGVHAPLTDKQGRHYSTDKGRSKAGSHSIQSTAYKQGNVYHGSTMNPVKGEMAQGQALRHKVAAKEQHKNVRNELHSMPKPNLGKARVDEGKSPEAKVQAREARNSRFPKRWVSGKEYPAQEGQFAGKPKSNSSQQSGVHEGHGNFIQGGSGSFSDNPKAKRDKIDVQAGHSMVMQGLKNQKKPNLEKDDMQGGAGLGGAGIDMMAMSEQAPKKRSAPMLRKIANKIKARRLVPQGMGHKKEVK